MNINDSPFKKGLYVKVPKGTPLYKSPWNLASTETSSRDVVVEISDVMIPDTENLLTRDEREARSQELSDLDTKFKNDQQPLYVKVLYPAVSYPASRGSANPHVVPAHYRDEIPDENRDAWNKLLDAHREQQENILQRYLSLAYSRLSADDLLILWSSNKKVTRAKYVELAEKPEARNKQPKVNLRQQMVPKSRWKFIQDVDIFYGQENPKFVDHVEAWDKANPRPTDDYSSQAARQKSSQDFQKWVVDRDKMRTAAAKSIGEFSPKLYRSIKAGDVITVTDKFRSFFMPNGWAGQRYGNVAVVMFDNETVEQGLEYNLIKDYIEAESIPIVKQFVLRHKTTGRYYKGYEWDGTYNSNGDTLEYADTFMKGKRWDNLGKAKTSILMMTGYYEGLPDADIMPDWSCRRLCDMVQAFMGIA